MPQWILTPDGWSEDPNPPGMPSRTGSIPADLLARGKPQRPTRVGETPGYEPSVHTWQPGYPTSVNPKYSHEAPTYLQPGFGHQHVDHDQQIVKGGGMLAALVVEKIGGGKNASVEVWAGPAIGGTQTKVAALLPAVPERGLQVGDRITFPSGLTDAQGLWLRIKGAPTAIELLVIAYKA